MKYLFYFLFFTAALSAQNITVLSADTREPVPFVTIILKTNGKVTGGLYCGENGVADINAAYDTAEFSCLGFETQIIDKAKVEKMVYLKPKAIVLDEVMVSSVKLKDTLIGEYKEKKLRNTTIGDANSCIAVFFENTFDKDVPIRSLWLKLAKIKYTTTVRVHVYSRKDYGQVYWDTKEPKDQHSYDSFVPLKDIYEQNIIVSISPKDKKELQIDLSGYNLDLPKEGAFIGLEVLGYFDESGQAVKTTSGKELTWIEMHQALNDNFCQKITVGGTTWDAFWVNINKWHATDMKAMGRKLNPKNLWTPTIGLIVGY
ncbi:hypothetical protein ACLI1A_00395 [Flavobacterium sp. RHBU_3]|uniref:hypothetical protein n=1 Tax=Flavobacterium sp. RHBU_3 TaxID=3391184 RepID=UPI003984771D